jgi:20S proteasome alpha/beta subunit
MSITAIPKLPNKLRKPYIQPDKQGSKAMTVGIGFGCADGLILGADRQMTRSGLNKFHEEKVFHTLTREYALVLVGADDLNLAKEVWNKLLRASLIPDVQAIRECFEGILNDLGRFYTDLPIQLILGVATKDKTALFEFRGRGLREVSDWGEFCVIGIGDASLTRYLAKRIEFFWMNLNEGIVAATYILKRTEEFVDMCSGPMDIVTLSIGPQLQLFDPALVDKLDERIRQNHLKAFTALLSLSPPFSI